MFSHCSASNFPNKKARNGECVYRQCDRWIVTIPIDLLFNAQAI